MFRNKHMVDRHVQETFRKVKNENERALRCYNIAKLYFKVNEYESARRYVSRYLETRDDQAGPHKLLGEIYEALGQNELALAQYKQSLELEARQDDLVLKVCELLSDMDIGHDVNRAKYWVERADAIFPHHPTVFQLKEKLLTLDRPNVHNADLEALIAGELSVKPSDVNLRVKLLKYYTDKNRLDDAYKHALEVESTHVHRDSVVWYEALCELLSKCKEGRETRPSYWLTYVSSFERYAALSLKEQGHLFTKTVPEAAQAIFNFDQALTEAKLQNFVHNASFVEHMFSHMWGQLHFHLACYLLRKTKREQGSWNDTGRLCVPMLLTALHVPPVDLSANWLQNLKEPAKSLIRLWRREAAFRCSQADHVLRSYARDNVKRMMDKVEKFCVDSWRERIYLRIFVSKAHIATSYFANHKASNPPLRLCSSTELKIYDEVSEEVWPASLHHHVWLGIANGTSVHNMIEENAGPRPHQYCHVFPDLQLSVFNLSQAAPDSLGQLDIDAFLNAAILCASVVFDDHQKSGYLNPDRLPILPVDITNTLCTATQEKWWASAYKIYRKRDELTDNIGEMRQELQRGLEVVRCIGNHGLHPAILVHLARIFHHRAKTLREEDDAHSDLPFIEARCELYWSAVVPLLERLLNNQAIRTTSTKMFDYQGKAMNNIELTNALEEGRLLLAQRHVRDKQHEKAIEALQALKCPEASFMQGTIYESLAEELMSNLPKECLTSAMRSQHIVMLSKARDCYYLTLDRLRSPGMNPKHPLNSELGTRIDEIENALKKIDPDVWRANRHDCDVLSEESYSSAHSGEHPVIRDSIPGALGHSIHTLGTPQKCSSHRVPKQASTPCRIQHQDVLELTRKSMQEARPSPERLDAQIRQLIHSKDNMIQTVLDQNKTLMETTKKLNDKIEELQKQLTNFFKENQNSRQHRGRSVSTGQNNVEDNLYVTDEDYGEANYSPGQQIPQNVAQNLSQNFFYQQQRAIPYHQALQNYLSTMPFNDPQHISSLYGNSRGVFPVPGYYPRPPMDPGLQPMPKMGENVPGMFGNRLMNQLGVFAPPPQVQPGMLNSSQLSMQMYNLDTTKNEIPAKDVPPIQQVVPSPPMVPSQPMAPSQPMVPNQPMAPSQPMAPIQPMTSIQQMAPSTRVPPVNVVITTSDTLPTTAPSVQPQLSVTIPPQYRAGSGPTSVGYTLGATTMGSNTSVSSTPMTMGSYSSTFAPSPMTFGPSTTMYGYANSPSNANSIPEAGSNATFNASSNTTTAPHSYQISMPSQAFIPTTVNLPPLSTTITNTISVAVAEQQNRQQEKKNQSAHNCSSEGSEYEADPLPDFVPIIPLPAEVQVTTGEENEETLFSARAKLYRWSNPEWKERGIGHVKILRNPEGKVRLVMRREQVLKICANHMLTSDMELTRMMNNDRTWIWVANDFADEEVKLEKFCIKFKFAEEGMKFKESFDKGKESSAMAKSPEVTPRKVESTKVPEVGSNVSEMVTKDLKSKSTVLGGFTFTTEPKTKEIATPETKKIEETKPSPFADFSFTKTDTSGFSFKNTKSGNDASKTGSHEQTTKKSEPKSSQSQIEIVGTLEDSEIIIYDKKANLMRSTDSSAWKNRGLGTVKLILDPKSGKLRLHAKRDETEKIFCNTRILGKTTFEFLKDTDNVITWTENVKGKIENLAILFESAEEAGHFKEILSNLQKKMTADTIPKNCYRQDGKSVRFETKEKSLAEIFKPPSGSWECGCCYTRNETGSKKCIACEAPKPGEKTSDVKKSDQASLEKTTEKSQEKNSEKPNLWGLWNQFVPSSDSWECQSCYIRNSRENSYCVACDGPRDPSMPPKPRTSGFGLTGDTTTSGFTFGIPKSNAQPETTTFTFGIPTSTPDFNFKLSTNEDKSETKGISIPRPTTPPMKENSFTFGSPGKSFDFQFPTKSPIKSPGDKKGGEASEDEVAESEDVYFAPVIPLPDKVDVKTGEEDEEVIWSHRAKLFRFDSTSKEWKERGLGDIKILKNPQLQKLRLVMRRDQTLKLCLNHAVNESMELKPKDEKTWLWNAADYSEGDIERLQLACRFKTPEIAGEFKKHLDQALEDASTGGNDNKTEYEDSPVKKEENSKKTEANTERRESESSHQDIQVVYEVKTSAEEKAAALKLQLPENFYAYTRKSDCPGCRGCEEPETPLFQDSQKNKFPSPSVKIAPPKFTSPNFTKTSENSSTSTDGNQKSIFQVGNVNSDEPKQFSGFVFGSGGEKSILTGTGDKSILSGTGKPSLFSGTGDKPIFSGTGNEKSMFSGSSQNKGSLNVNVENLTICSPNQKPVESQPLFGKSPFENFQTSFGSNLQNITMQTSIFGGNATKTSETPTQSSESQFPNIFGGSTKNSTGVSGFGFGAPSMASLVNSSNFTKTPFGESQTSKLSFSSLSEKGTAKENEKTEDIASFLPVQGVASFSTLAAQSSTNAFKKDPNFSFAGTGSTVFGAKSLKAASDAQNSTKTESLNESGTNSVNKELNSSRTKKDGEDEDEEDKEDYNEHDPHFEPIIPLPDAVEVRTGEEDEEVVFSQRAKLYRYESTTKEWKERGTGQMKLLHHSEHGTYRLLLRREQVHKVVCNLLVTADLELMPLNSSDCAWMWAAFNHAEEPYALEELAVKFKNAEYAREFKQAVENAKSAVRERLPSGQGRIHESDLSECYGEDEDGDEDDEPSVIFVSRADLLIYQGNNWKSEGAGVLKILYDSEIYGSKIIIEADNTGEILSNTVISMETTMEINKNACTWTAIDEVPNPPMRRTLQAIFATEELAHEMFMNFQDGLQYANQADISETSYYDSSFAQ